MRLPTHSPACYPRRQYGQWIEGILPTELDLMVDQARTAQLSDDGVTAEHILRQVLEHKPDHSEAGTSLASLLIDRGETDEALIVLGKLVPDAEVDRLQSAARLKASSGHDLADLEERLAADPENEEMRIELAMALAARAEYEPALDRLLSVVRDKGVLKDDARTAMLDIFGVLGDDHPLTITYRRQLAERVVLGGCLNPKASEHTPTDAAVAILDRWSSTQWKKLSEDFTCIDRGTFGTVRVRRTRRPQFQRDHNSRRCQVAGCVACRIGGADGGRSTWCYIPQ